MTNWGSRIRGTLGLILFSVLVAASCTNSLIGYSEEVQTIFKSGPGFSAFGRIYYLVNYQLYRTPRGIMRFPDGGQSRIVFRGTYLMTASNQNRPQVVMRLPVELDDLGIAGTDGIKDDQTLILEVRNLGDSQGHSVVIEESDVIYLPKVRIPSASPLLEPNWDMTQTNNSLRQYLATEIGLPSPLEYVKKTPRAYRKDVVRLKGDFQYRREIIAFLDIRGETASRLLEKMDDYENSLTGYKRDKYHFIAEDTRAVLEGATDD